MADVTINATAATTYGARHVRPVVFISASLGYAFFISSANGDLYYAKTTDGGASWGAAILIYSSPTSNVAAFDVWYDQWTPGNSGTQIYIWGMDNGDYTVNFYVLDTSDDSVSTKVVLVTGLGGGGAVALYISGTIARGGNLYAQFHTDATDTNHRLYRSTDGGASWSSRTSCGENNVHGDICILFPGNEADTNDIWGLFWDADVDYVTLKVYDDSANSVSESATIASTYFYPDDYQTRNLMSGAIRHSDGHLIVVINTEVDTAAADCLVVDIASSSSWTAKANITTNIDDFLATSLFIDQATDDIYVAYLGKRDGSQTWYSALGVYYTKSDDGGATWSSGDTAYSNGTGQYTAARTPMQGPVFAVTWLDKTNGDVLTNAGNNLDLSPPGAGIPVLVAHQRFHNLAL